MTHCSLDDRTIDILIALENIGIFLHRLYLETFAYSLPTARRLIIFVSVLIILQIAGFLLNMFTRYLLDRIVQRRAKL
jgi:hypothetical protein